MKAAIFEQSVDQLATLVEEGARANKISTKRFIEPEPAQGTLRRARARRHHMVFGRRGSGKTSLLYKSAEELEQQGRAVAYVDLEPFKGHHYPDVLISVLLASLSKFCAWLCEQPDQASGKRLWWALWLLKRRLNSQASKGNLIDFLGQTIEELTKQLQLSDNATLVEYLKNSLDGKQVAELKGSAKGKVFPFETSIESAIAASVQSTSTKEIQEEYKRSKTEYLHHKILDFQKIFNDITAFTANNCYLFLDDLYHIRRSDQARVLDYFHRIGKGNNLWIKVGTIKNRSKCYVHSPQPIGFKLGDDADEINLDLTLEKFSICRKFLKTVLDAYVVEARAPALDKLISDGGLDRLVIASGGVARDFLGIFRRAIDETRERLTKRPNHPRGPKIGAEDVNPAAGSYGDTKKEELRRDTLEDTEPLIQAFSKIRTFCLDKTKSNVFLVDQDIRGTDHDLLQELIDLRLIHHIRSRVTVSARPGKVFRALLLDVSQYTGERKRYDVEMVDFWKEAKKEQLRRASIIYDPKIGIEDLKKEAEARKATSRQQDLPTGVQEKLNLKPGSNH